MNANPYSLPQEQKETILLSELNKLTQLHHDKCPSYARLLHLFWSDKTLFNHVADLPYLPVNLFKTQKLISIPPENVYKILQSSGTTSSHPSKIFLDSDTAYRQTMALASVMTAFLGKNRLPMLVIDHPNVIRNRHQYNARGAAIVGMLSFGRDVCYALNEEMKLDHPAIHDWLKRHYQQPILLFGLTFVVWEHFLCQLSQEEIQLPQGILIHTGGWKKLQEKAISNALFKERLKNTTLITHCHNFYGMVEQIGSVFMECEHGFLHCPQFADIIIRHPKTWKEHESGVIQLLSTLPHSYPGHSILTEDLGVLCGIDDCSCGRKGKYFHVIGRVPLADLRGCSDTLPSIQTGIGTQQDIQ